MSFPPGVCLDRPRRHRAHARVERLGAGPAARVQLRLGRGRAGYAHHRRGRPARLRVLHRQPALALLDGRRADRLRPRATAGRRVRLGRAGEARWPPHRRAHVPGDGRRDLAGGRARHAALGGRGSRHGDARSTWSRASTAARAGRRSPRCRATRVRSRGRRRAESRGEDVRIRVRARDDRGGQHDAATAMRKVVPDRECLAGENPTGALPFALFPVAPNPAPAGGTFRLILPGTAGEATTRASALVVYDARGRAVWRRTFAESEVGEFVLAWDGRDDAWASRPSGRLLLATRPRGTWACRAASSSWAARRAARSSPRACPARRS